MLRGGPVDFKRSITVGLLMTLLVFSPAAISAVPAGEKMTPEELVAKHLESIGPAAARASINTRIIIGTSFANIRLPIAGQNRGLAMLFSEGEKNLIAMTFKNPEYPYDKFGYDGDKLTVSFVAPGVRSPLGDFLHQRDFVFKQGLIGGVLSASWPLLKLAAKNPKLEYSGTKKIGSQILHELRYVPRKGTDMKISLFFEPETFRHVRTEYEKIVAARIGERTYTNVQERESRYRLAEKFSEFKQEGGLTLPHTYQVELVIDTQNGTFQGEWTFNLSQFVFNQPIAEGSFNVNTD